MFGTDIMNSGFMLASLLALSGGILSFLSPCVLPIVPPYLAYMSGISMAEAQAGGTARRTLGPALAFVLGLSTVFMLLGFTASMLAQFYLDYRDTFVRVSGAVVVLFGLHFLHVIRIPLLNREARLDAGDRGGSAFGAYVLGLAFAFGWTPCIGPQLQGILTLAADQASVGRGTALLGIYALGLGIPFLLSALFLQRSMAVMTRLKRHMGLIERIMGVMLVIVGLALMTDALSTFSFWLLETFPALGRIG